MEHRGQGLPIIGDSIPSLIDLSCIVVAAVTDRMAIVAKGFIAA